MKKKLLFGITALTLSVVGVAAIGSHLNNEMPAVEAKADPVYSRIFFKGSDNGWAAPDDNSNTYKFEYLGARTEGGVTSHYYSYTVDLTKNSEFGIVDWDNGHNVENEGWMVTYDGTKCLQYLKNQDNGNLRCLMDGNYTITYRWASGSDRCIVGFELNDATEMYFVRNPDYGYWTSSTLYVHAWTNSGELTLPGYAAQLNPVPGIEFGVYDLNFYRFQIPDTATGFMVMDHYDTNTDWKTGTLTRSEGTCYTCSGSPADGVAGALIGKIYSAMGQFTNDNSETYYNSICAIDATTRGEIATAYTNLSNTTGAKGVFDVSTMNTYDPEDLSSKTDVSFADIIIQLDLNTTNNLPVFVGVSNKDSSAVLIVTFAATALAAASVFLARKRKTN